MTMDLRKLANELTKSLTQGHVRNNSIFVSTGVIYPNGVGVTIRIDLDQGGFLISDDGYAEVIADDMGALPAFYRVASGVASRTGVIYDKGAFIVHNVERSTLLTAITTVANASATTLERLVALLEQPRIKRSREIFDKRLKAAFGSQVAFDVEIQGATGKRWEFGAGVGKKGVFERLFELVSPTTQSVAIANMKISDVRALNAPPNVVAALTDYDKTDPALRSILSSAGGMVIAANDDVAKYQLIMDANA